MQINRSTGLLEGVNVCLSPNYDDRPANQLISLLVIHNISLPPGDFDPQWIQRFFINQLPADAHPYFAQICQLKVSSHLYLTRQGEIWQFVPFSKRAWHAGRSTFEGKQDCNDFSIGIELAGSDETPYTDPQYAALSKVTNAILGAYAGITSERIVGHSDIAPERKTDPGPYFDWVRYKKLINQT